MCSSTWFFSKNGLFWKHAYTEARKSEILIPTITRFRSTRIFEKNRFLSIFFSQKKSFSICIKHFFSTFFEKFCNWKLGRERFFFLSKNILFALEYVQIRGHFSNKNTSFSYKKSVPLDGEVVPFYAAFFHGVVLYDCIMHVIATAMVMVICVIATGIGSDTDPSLPRWAVHP